MSLDPAWIALIGTVFGGVGLKVMDHYLGKKRSKVDDATRMRDELRIQINQQNEVIAKLEIESDKWQAAYYDIRDKMTEINTELTILKIQMNKANTEETL